MSRDDLTNQIGEIGKQLSALAAKLDKVPGEERIRTLVKEELSVFNGKLMEFENSLGFLSKDVEELQTDTREVQQEIAEHKDRLATAEEEIQKNRDFSRDVDLRLRANNLVIYGLPETQNENSIVIATEFLKNEIDVDVSAALSDVFRMGKVHGSSSDNQPAQSRPLKVLLFSRLTKRSIMENFRKDRKNFDEKGIRIRDDLPGWVRALRQGAWPLMQKLYKNKGHLASFREHYISFQNRNFYTLDAFRSAVDRYLGTPSGENNSGMPRANTGLYGNTSHAAR